MYSRFRFLLCFSLIWVHDVTAISLLKNQHSYFMDNMDPENDLANFINSRSYMQNDRKLPKVSIIKNVDNDVTYLLSKLSDEELIKLLNTQPTKSEYDLDDIVNITFDSKSGLDNILKNSKAQSHRNTFNENVNENSNKFNFKPTTKTDKDPMAFFRLENKEVDPYVKSDDSNYRAVQKLSDLLNNYQMNANSEDLGLDDDKKELLFDILVSQLKTLCCKKSKPLARNIMYKYMPEATQKMSHEYIFLIVNDEIKNNGSDELMSVDPNSLDKNSSVLLLGPITTPLTDSQLKTVINRISKELSQPEYLPLLQLLSNGTLSDKNVKLSKNLISRSETRRYIKPHRCNHQSKLAKIYGGPKWLVCTGYLNLNVPSLYD